METLAAHPGARRDNAGLISVPVESLPPGCKGAACPAFARCQGRCGSQSAALLARMVQTYGRQVEGFAPR